MKAKPPRNSSGSAKSKMGIRIALFLQSIQKTTVKDQLTYYHTLARRGEIAFRLQWEDIDFERRTIRLFTRKRSNAGL